MGTDALEDVAYEAELFLTTPPAEKRAAEKQRYELAEQKRQLAEAAIGRLSRIVCNAFNGS